VFEKWGAACNSRSVLKTDELYATDLTDEAWALVAPILPAARPDGRPRTTNLRAVISPIFYLLRTGCQWRLLPHEFPAWGTVYHPVEGQPRFRAIQ
jgi:transposase